jgi:hypothetical protein
MPDTSMTEVITTGVKEFRTTVPECVAAGIVDMSTGMLLAVDTVDNHPEEVLDLLAAATFDIFQGRNVVMIEEVWNQRRGTRTAEHYFQEILINSQNLVHLFMRSATNAEIVAVVVCRRMVNIGMLFAQSRMVMRRLDAELV